MHALINHRGFSDLILFYFCYEITFFSNPGVLTFILKSETSLIRGL
jgi:hypothetical protein